MTTFLLLNHILFHFESKEVIWYYENVNIQNTKIQKQSLESFLKENAFGIR